MASESDKPVENEGKPTSKHYWGPRLFAIWDIPSQAEEHEVKIAIARAYHKALAQGNRRRRPEAEDGDGPGLMNLEIKLHYQPDSSGRLQSKGSLLLPTGGGPFWDYVEANPVYVPYLPDWNNKAHVESVKISFTVDTRKWSKAVVQNLKATPWQNPRLEVEHKERVKALSLRPQLMEIQFGFDHFRKVNKPVERMVHRFSVEWCRKFDSKTDARADVTFMDSIHAIQIQIGDHTTGDYDFIKVRYENVKEMAVKSNTVIFTLWNAPILERGPDDYDEKRQRSRLSGLDEQHKRVMAVFPKKFRITLYSAEEMDQFKAMAKVVGLKTRDADRRTDTDGGLGDPELDKAKRNKRRAEDYLNYLTDIKMKEINDKWLNKIPFEVAFQVAVLLQNGLLNPIEIRSLQPIITALLSPRSKRTSAEIADLLYQFSRSIASWTMETRLSSTIEERFEKFKEAFWAQKAQLPKTLKPGWSWCYRATITPTTITLDGPSREQSNGVVRRYGSDAFLRVNFTDEDRVQIRTDRDIDGETFVRERLGGILSAGVEIAGHHFRFLGYSSSGLREHSLWFVRPFKDENNQAIDAETIRDRIGDFSGDLEHQPAKLGARLAQAFSSTEPSIELKEEEIEVIEDILAPPTEPIYSDPAKTTNGYEADEEVTEAEGDCEAGPILLVPSIVREFTDGYGCMSIDLANDIWEELNQGVVPLPQPRPAAYQVRIGGAKGVIGINPNLKGRKVVLHKSMVKFPSQDRGIHIAVKFDHPLPLYLNRPLVAILEHSGVAIEWFERLQKRHISKADNTLLSISEAAADFFMASRLGRSYGFGKIIRYLAKNNISRPKLESAPHPLLDFYRMSLQIARVHIDRELKYKARIHVEGGHSLVGVADVHGELKEGHVYICTQKSGQETWQYFPEKPGTVYVTRSPSIHPGDVQRFTAMHPPKGSLYDKYPMVNCIVFSCKGPRPPASYLGGGDLDGDLFQIIPESEDFRLDIDTPAEYPPVIPLKLSRRATIDDIADFVVEYVNSDKMGLIATQHLIISDQSRHGLHEPKCMTLAELHSKAVDFAKSGVPVPMKDLPKKLHRFVPDFQYKEAKLDDYTKYYESPKALGVLFRNIKVRSAPSITATSGFTDLAKHPIWTLLMTKCKDHLRPGAGAAQEKHVKDMFTAYVRELKGIREIFSMGHTPLSEEEVFMGTILEQSNNRKRDDMAAMLREISGQLVDHVRSSFMGYKEDDPKDVWLARSLYGWQWAYSPAASKSLGGVVVNDRKESQCSFGMIALRSAFECLDVIEKSSPDPRLSKLSAVN